MKSEYFLSLNSFYHNNKRLLLIIFLAAILRIALFIFVAPWDSHVLETKILVMDAGGYHTLALELLNNKSFVNFGTFRTPGYPLFLTIIYFLFGIKPWLVLFFQIILNIISLILVYRIGQIIFKKEIGLIAALLFAIEPHQIFYSISLLSDPLFVSIFLLSSFYFLSGLKKNKSKYFLLSSILLGISTLIRSITILFPIVIILAVGFNKKITYYHKLRTISLYLICFIITLSPWLIRNYVSFGYAQLSSVSGTNLLFYNVASTEAEKTGIPLDQISNRFKSIAEERGALPYNNPFDNSKIYNEIAIEYIGANFPIYILRHVKGIINMFIGVGSERIADMLELKSTKLKVAQYSAPSFINMFTDFFRTKSIGEIIIALSIAGYLIICYLFFIAGTTFLIKNKEYYYLIIIGLVIIYLSTITGVVGLARYKLPITPFYLIISAKGIFEIIGRYSPLIKKRISI